MSESPLPFTFIDVFTETPFKGNPLAVVTIPVGVTLTQAQKQAIARESNLSETVFVHDVEDPATSTEQRFDIFTPLTELPWVIQPSVRRYFCTRMACALYIQPAANGALRAAIHDAWREGWATRRYYFVRLGSEHIGGRTVHKIRTRMVNQRIEDPATGSAACALSSYLSLHVLEQASLTFEITQGVEMGRDSNIMIDVEVSEDIAGNRKLESLHLGGKAVPVMSGCITSRP